jgi:hypothetical protein
MTLILIGPSFAIGLVVWVVPVQILGSGLVVNLAIFGILTMFVVLIGPRRLGRFQFPNDSIPSVLKVLATATGLAFVMTSGEWPSFIFAGIGFLALSLLLSESPIAKYKFLLNLLFIALSLTVLGWSSSQLQTFGWLITEDYSYLEALRVHLAEFGIWQSFGPTNISMYYWISPAWVGQVSQITLAADWLVVTRVTTFLFSLSLAATTICLIDSFTMGRFRTASRIVVVASLVFVIVATRIDYSGTSTFAVFAISSSLIFIALRAAKSRFPKRSLAPIALMLLATVFTKLMAAPISVSLLALIAIGYLLTGKRILLVGLCATVFFLCLPFILFLDNARQLISSGDVIVWDLKNIDELMSAQLIRDLAPHAFLLVIPVLVAVFVSFLNRSNSEEHLVLAASAILALSFALISLLLIRPTDIAIDVKNYFARPSTYFSQVAVASSIVLSPSRSVSSAMVGAASSLIFIPNAGVTERLLRLLGSLGDLIAEQTVIVNEAIPLMFALLVAAVFAYRMCHNAKNSFRQYLIEVLASVLLVVICTVSLQSMVGRAFQTFSGGPNVLSWSSRESNFVTSVMGDPELEAVGRWIRTHSDDSEIIATNALCEFMPGQLLYDSDLDCVKPGTDHTLARTSHRRFVVLGPRFHYENPIRRDAAVRASLKYGESFSDADRKILQRLGARFFVYCNTCTRNGTLRILNDTHQPLFELGRYSVVSLEK